MAEERDFTEVQAFLARFNTTAPKRRSRVAAQAPLRQLQEGALHHADPFVRRRCLAFLDHYASDASAHVFAQALADPVEPVRHIALHAIACETCRTAALCAADVVPPLVAILAADPSVEVRHKTIPILLRLADRDARARDAIKRAVDEDPDELLREVASRALAGQHIRARRAYERHARRRPPGTPATK